MNNVSDPHIVFTKNGELILSFKGTKEIIFLKDIKTKFGNKMGFLVSLFDLPVELENNISFNQILMNLKFFEKEFEILFSEIKAPKNNTAAKKIFELLKKLNKENINFLSIMNEERNLLANSLLKNNVNQPMLEFIGKKKEFSEDELHILIKKVVTEKQIIQLGKDTNSDKQISLSTRARIFSNNEVVELKDKNAIQILMSKVILDDKSQVKYIISFEDILKCLFKDLLIFRSKDEIKTWKEEIHKYQNIYTKNVVYLNEVRNFFKGENMLNDEFGKYSFNKSFGGRNINDRQTKNLMSDAKKMKEKMTMVGFLQDNSVMESKENKRATHLKLVSSNEKVISEKSTAQVKIVKEKNV